MLISSTTGLHMNVPVRIETEGFQWPEPLLFVKAILFQMKTLQGVTDDWSYL